MIQDIKGVRVLSQPWKFRAAQDFFDNDGIQP